MSVLRAALAYWAGVFALGFVLGTLRTLWLTPLLGDLAAVAAELPVILAASWWWSVRVLRRHPQPTRGAALAMGALAFALLMGAELALGMALGGLSASAWLASLGSPAGALGLAGQVAFAAIPALRWRQRPGTAG
jgi:hypothetical protein